jgi:glycosyltransferase involved in cell wall biosynthesis
MRNVMLLASALHTGGAERVIANLVRHVDRDRFRVTVCHLKNRGRIGEELAHEGFDVVGVQREGRPVLRYLTFRNLDRVLRERRIDLIHTHTHYALADAMLTRLSNWRPIKLVHTFHFGNYPHLPGRYLMLEGLGARAADRLVAVGVEQSKAVCSTFNLDRHRVDVIVNGAEPGKTPVDETWRERLRQPGALVIGTICTFIEQKGLPDLLRVAAELKSRRVHAKFVVVGDGPLRERIEAECRAQGLAGDVFFTGMLHDASSSILPLFDVFFQPSLWEAMSMVVIEAMAAGRPVVATDVGDNRHVVIDGECGRICPPRDVAAMSRALEELARSPELRERLGAAGRRRYSQLYTVQEMARAHEQMYADVLAS